MYGPVVDGAFLKETVLKTVLHNQHDEVDVLVGSNEDEVRGILELAFLRDIPNPLPDKDYLELVTSRHNSVKKPGAKSSRHSKLTYGTN